MGFFVYLLKIDYMARKKEIPPAHKIILRANGFKREVGKLDYKIRKYTLVELANLVNKYFEWMEEELIEGKPRAFTKQGLCTFLGITYNTLERWREDEEYEEVFDFIDNVVYDHTITHALAGVYKEQLAIRMLGLADKQDHTVQEESKVTIFELPNNNR